MSASLYSVTVPPGTIRPIECVNAFVYQSAPSSATATSCSPLPVNVPEQGCAAKHGGKYSEYPAPSHVATRYPGLPLSSSTNHGLPSAVTAMPFGPAS